MDFVKRRLKTAFNNALLIIIIVIINLISAVF